MIETTLFYCRESHLETPPLYMYTCVMRWNTLTVFSVSLSLQRHSRLVPSGHLLLHTRSLRLALGIEFHGNSAVG